MEKPTKPYRFGVSRVLVYIFHILVGAWIAYVGFLITQKEKSVDASISTANRVLLACAGLLTITYHLVLWLWFPAKMYACKTPSWMIHSVHLVIGIVLLLLAWKPEVAPAWTGIIPIIFGGTGALYMLHVWVTK